MALPSGIEDVVVDEELNALFKELADQHCETTTEEYIDFDVETCSSMPAILESKFSTKIYG